MLSRAFTNKPRRSPQFAAETNLQSASMTEYEEFIYGFMDDDVPLTSLYDYNDIESYNSSNKVHNKSTNNSESSSTQLTLRQILRSSVGVMGESPLGMTEKVALLGGKICAVKRFRRVGVRKREFGRRIEKVAQIGHRCDYLVPVTAYLYAKRIKFVVCDYYPMGSLADLLSGARELGQTAIAWKHRLKIIQCVAKAIAFIHSQSPPRDKHLQLNVHGNIKSSNIMINIDFTAHLSDYGFVQLAEHVAVEVDDTGQADQSHALPPERVYNKTLSRENDMYNFGVVLMDILGWPNVVSILEVKSDLLFEFNVEGRELKQALKVLDIALRCTQSLPDDRPTIEEVLSCLGNNMKS